MTLHNNTDRTSNLQLQLMSLISYSFFLFSNKNVLLFMQYENKNIS